MSTKPKKKYVYIYNQHESINFVLTDGKVQDKA